MNFLKLFNRKGLLIAHRGASGVAPENTLAALKKSVGLCDFMEIDVCLSSDGVPIVLHDDTLSRTTNVKEMEIFRDRAPYRVCDFTLKELKELDYGVLWDSKEPLLTLGGALEFIKKSREYLNVEIKDMAEDFSDEVVVSSVLEEIKKYGVENQVLVSSFRHEYLLLCKKALRDLPTAALVEGKHPQKLIEYLKNLKVDAYHLNKELVDKKTVKELKDAGFFVNVYTLKNKALAQEFFDVGVNGAFVDSI